MIINSSNIYMDSSRQFQSQQTGTNSLFIGNTSQTAENISEYREEESYKMKNFTSMLKQEMIDDSTADMEQSMLGMRSRSAAAAKMSAVQDLRDSQLIQEKSILYILRYFRQLIHSGYTHQTRHENMQTPNQLSNAIDLNLLSSGGQTGMQQSTIIGSFSGVYAYSEVECTSFSTMGKVVTADGREIDFQVDVEMSRSFEEYVLEKIDVEAYPSNPLIDPLVINLNGSTASVRNQKFLFDLDADGKEDEISMLDAGSGFLALDKNEDGIINDGSELFGTASGDGFKDLAKFDVDGNGWIDEQDSVFDQLRIWSKDDEGNDVLYRLKDAGVGAICLQRAKTDFALNSLEDNKTNAVIRQTGIFLYENGNVGTVQHLDMAT